MKLYHGTSSTNLKSILTEGLKPRGRKKGNWSHSIESNPKAVYLTIAYPFHFAHNVSKKENLVVFEVETDLLPPWLLAPDEDFLEQVTRDKEEWSHVTGDFIARTRWFRKRALKEFGHNWELSIKGMGTCCFYGKIAPTVIKRYAIVPYTSNIALKQDATITPLNYLIIGPYYRDLVRHTFGDPLQEQDSHTFRQREVNGKLWGHNLEDTPRDGIEVVTL